MYLEDMDLKVLELVWMCFTHVLSRVRTCFIHCIPGVSTLCIKSCNSYAGMFYALGAIFRLCCGHS